MSIKINPTNGKTAPLEVVPHGTSLHQFAFMKTKSTDREVRKAVMVAVTFIFLILGLR